MTTYDIILAVLCVLVLVAIFRVDAIRRWLTKRDARRIMRPFQADDGE